MVGRGPLAQGDRTRYGAAGVKQDVHVRRQRRFLRIRRAGDGVRQRGIGVLQLPNGLLKFLEGIFPALLGIIIVFPHPLPERVLRLQHRLVFFDQLLRHGFCRAVPRTAGEALVPVQAGRDELPGGRLRIGGGADGVHGVAFDLRHGDGRVDPHAGADARRLERQFVRIPLRRRISSRRRFRYGRPIPLVHHHVLRGRRLAGRKQRGGEQAGHRFLYFHSVNSLLFIASTPS